MGKLPQALIKCTNVSSLVGNYCISVTTTKLLIMKKTIKQLFTSLFSLMFNGIGPEFKDVKIRRRWRGRSVTKIINHRFNVVYLVLYTGAYSQA